MHDIITIPDAEVKLEDRARSEKSTEPVFIGFDSEWVTQEDRNLILSVQLAMRHQGAEFQPKICYTKAALEILRPGNPENRLAPDRFLLRKIIPEYIVDAKREGFLTRWPRCIHLAAHWTRADLPHFADYRIIKHQVDGIRKTYATISKMFRVSFDHQGHWHSVEVQLVDTTLLAPGTSKSLERIGKLYDRNKVNLPDGAIERMDLLLRDNPELFERYAVQDAVITALHADKIRRFALDDLKLGIYTNKTPATLSSIAINYTLDKWKHELGIDPTYLNGKIEQRVSEYSGKGYRTKIVETPLPGYSDYENLAIRSYHGGRNECYWFGPTEVASFGEYDLDSAYASALASVCIPAWEHAFASTNLADYKADVLGLAEIHFKFPRGTKFPSLPVHAGNYGLIYPLSGEAACTAPEIATALAQGAVIEIKRGVIVPWLSDIRPYEIVLKDLLERRAQFPKGSLRNELYKLLGNSLYGKTAQGLRTKRVFATRTDMYEEMGHSRITNPYFASYVTGLVRAVLSELLNAARGLVISATTDSVLAEELPDICYGPASRVLEEARLRLTNSPKILKLDRTVEQVASFRTRGIVTLRTSDRPKLAKAGMREPDGVIDANQYFVERLFMRTPDDRWSVKRPESLASMHKANADFIMAEHSSLANFEYDFKRRPVDPNMREVTFPMDNGNLTVAHLAFGTTPWNTVNEFIAARETFERWRRGNQKRGVPRRMLRDIHDWLDFEAFWLGAPASRGGVRRSQGGVVDQARRLVIRAFAAGLWGLPGSGFREAAEALSAAGYQTTETDFKNARRRRQQVSEGIIPADAPGIAEFVDVIKGIWPGSEPERMLVLSREKASRCQVSLRAMIYYSAQ